MNYREDIKAYIDGELSPDRAEEVRAAIEADAGLREEYEFMKAVSNQIQASAKMPEVRGVERALDAVRPVRRFNWRAGLAIAGVAVIFIVFASPTLFSGALVEEADVAMETGEVAVPDTALEMDMESGLGASRDRRDQSKPSSADAPQYGNESLDDEDESAWDKFDGVNPRRAEHPARPDTASSAVEMKVKPGHPGSAGVGGGGFGGGASGGMRGGIGGGGAAGNAAFTENSTGNLGGATAKRMSVPLESGSKPIVIKSGNFEIWVDDVAKSVRDTSLLVKQAGGKVSTKSSDDGRGGVAVWMTLQVPQEKFDEVVKALRKMGDVQFDKPGENNVTKSLAKLEKEIEELKAKQVDDNRGSSKLQALDADLKKVEEQIKGKERRRDTQRMMAKMPEINVYFEKKR